MGEPAPAEPIPRPTIWVFGGTTGRFLRSWGENAFRMPHGLTVDRQDNVWVTDVGLHQVFKFSHDGRLLLKLGEAGTPGTDTSHFNLPTDGRRARRRLVLRERRIREHAGDEVRAGRLLPVDVGHSG